MKAMIFVSGQHTMSHGSFSPRDDENKIQSSSTSSIFYQILSNIFFTVVSFVHISAHSELWKGISTYLPRY